eukprot:3770058-Prymnesium_polylepis.1
MPPAGSHFFPPANVFHMSTPQQRLCWHTHSCGAVARTLTLSERCIHERKLCACSSTFACAVASFRLGISLALSEPTVASRASFSASRYFPFERSELCRCCAATTPPVVGESFARSSKSPSSWTCRRSLAARLPPFSSGCAAAA